MEGILTAYLFNKMNENAIAVRATQKEIADRFYNGDNSKMLSLWNQFERWIENPEETSDKFKLTKRETNDGGTYRMVYIGEESGIIFGKNMNVDIATKIVNGTYRKEKANKDRVEALDFYKLPPINRQGEKHWKTDIHYKSWNLAEQKNIYDLDVQKPHKALLNVEIDGLFEADKEKRILNATRIMNEHCRAVRYTILRKGMTEDNPLTMYMEVFYDENGNVVKDDKHRSFEFYQIF